LENALGLAAGLRDNPVGVGRRLVLQALLVSASSLNVAEGIDDLSRWIDLLQLDLVDADTDGNAVPKRYGPGREL
jgi:hypothetical protein